MAEEVFARGGFASLSSTRARARSALCFEICCEPCEQQFDRDREVERRNFEGLVGLLREARWQVKVAVVGSREAFARGEVKGVWQLGAAQGGLLGVLVWFESDEHVAVLLSLIHI